MSFKDADFPHTNKSLYQNGDAKGDETVVSWRRPCEFAKKKVELFVDGSSAGDVQQGALGDCWFLGALSVVATRDDLLRQLFEAHDVEAGKFTCRFFKSGKWHSVTVDDYLPCGKSGLPVYARSADLHEIWVMLLEKAYAKLHGFYAALEGGSVSEGLVDLTGGAPEEIDLHTPEGKEMTANGELWQRLLYFKREEWLMGCGNVSADGAVEEDMGQGILQNHAYGLMDMVTTSSGVKLLKVRNPWGEREWRGAWSDGAPEWTDAIKAELKVEFGDDGVFWMCLDDFVAQFNKIYCVRLYDDAYGKVWQRTTINGEWKGKSAGGTINYPTWHNSPQYHIKVTKPDTDLYIVLGQDDIRMPTTARPGGGALALPMAADPGNNYKHKIGFYVLATDDPSIKLNKTLTQDDVVAKMTFLNMRQVAMDAKLEPGRDYVLHVATFDPDVEMPYTLDIFADEDVTVTEIGEPNEASAEGEWRGATAGGCVNHPTWKDNPMFYFRPSAGGSKLHVALEQLGDGEPHYAGVMLFRAPHSKRLITPDGECVWKTEITNARKVGGLVELPPLEGGGDAAFVLVPSTFDPNAEARFRVSLAGAGQVPALAPCDEWVAAKASGSWRGVAAGGCPNHATWRNNPQYVLSMPDGTSGALDVTITLTADDAAREKHVGVYVVKAADGRRVVDVDEAALVAKSQFVPGAVTLKAPLNAADGPFTLLVFTFDADVEADFELSAFADVTLSLAPITLDAAPIAAVDGQWAGEAAGGCTNHATWVNNPKYTLRLRGAGGAPTRVTMVLTQPGEPGVTGIGCMLLKHGETPALDTIIAEAPLVMHTFVSHTFTTECDAAGTYWLAPCTFDAGVNRSFKLYVYTDVAAELSADA